MANMSNIKLSNCGNARNKNITHNGLGLVGGNGIGYNFRGDDLVMGGLLAILLEGGVTQCSDRGQLLDELFGRDFVTDEGLVLEGLDVLVDWDRGTTQLDGLGGRLEHGVRVGVGAAVVRAHGYGCDGWSGEGRVENMTLV